MSTDLSVVDLARAVALEAHKNHYRKYNGRPYSTHLEDVVWLLRDTPEGQDPEVPAMAWLHDTIEDQVLTIDFVLSHFGPRIADGVLSLSDLLPRSFPRKARKTAYLEKLRVASGEVQTIKVADIISNTVGLGLYDPAFAENCYLHEKEQQLQAMTKANANLLRIALAVIRGEQCVIQTREAYGV
jgi:GTP diphosphokinase / guanosine-3',5'-bis(diphosphate) 3'-diphosphatase